MRAGLVWRHAQPGVLLYTPAPRVSIDDTEQSLSQLRVLDCTSSGNVTKTSDVYLGLIQTSFRCTNPAFGSQRYRQTILRERAYCLD